MENTQPRSHDDEGNAGDPGEPPVHWQEEGVDDREKAEIRCFCSKTEMPFNEKHIVSCCRKVAGEINARHDIVVNILLNNILIQRRLVTHEQKWEDRKMVRAAHDEITIGTEHWRSEERKEKGRVTGAKLKPDLVWLRRDSGDQ